MRILAAILLFYCVVPFHAQSPSTSQAPKKPEPSIIVLNPEANSELIRLGGQLMMAGKAYEYDRQLADEIGPRLTGSEKYVKATDWAVAEFTRLGLSSVHREAWEIPATWEPETLATARMIVPHEQRLHLESEGWSPSTPVGGLRGAVYYLASCNPDAVKNAAAEIRNSIVLVDSDSLFGEDPLLFGRLFDALREIGEEGARGLIFGLGATNNAPNLVGNSDFNGSLANVPTGNLGREDTLLLKRLLKQGPVEVEFSFKNRIREHVKVNNVVAEIPGRENNGEYVLVAGHLDSWDPGTGAQDNGTGAATVMAVAEAIKASGHAPRRTMRFILFGGEEEGLIGSIRYARDHAAEIAKCDGVFVTDTGAESPKGWYTFGRSDENQALDSIKPLLDSLGAGERSNSGDIAFDTDHAPFLVQGVPSFVLWTPMEKYMQLHHKPSDTFEKVVQRDLNLGAAVVGVTAYAFADAPLALKHYSASEVEEQLKSIKALAQYKDLQDHKFF